MVSKPHGGKLVKRLMSEKAKERTLEEKNSYIRISISERAALDLENIAYGIYSPLDGFLREDDLISVLNDMHLSDGLAWTIPIVLDVNEGNINFTEGDEILLCYNELPIAKMDVDNIYKYNKKEYAQKVFKTTDINHPGVANTYKMGDYLIGGDIKLINEIPNKFSKYTLRPEDTRKLFKKNTWKTIVAFQTRNVPHLGHEYLQKSALTFVDGLFINPVLGKKKKGDYKDEVILKAYETLFKHYYPKDSAVLATVRYEMRYAGPREAIHHAIMRKNFGCTHFIVGRDHAGVGNYYGPYEAQEIFKNFPDLGITPMFFKEFFYCKKCKGIVNEKICPHPMEDREYFSGTKIRNMIVEGKEPPEYFMRKEVYETIMSFENPFVGDE
ncbi:sulfate adenylyltransferase [Methanocaldococcus lauensis]|nr:sulfate adenylyltransferase [Methanocaldococcus lauensis]